MTPPCRSCLFWQRRVGEAGRCWQRDQPTVPMSTTADATCDQHTPKVVQA